MAQWQRTELLDDCHSGVEGSSPSSGVEVIKLLLSKASSMKMGHNLTFGPAENLRNVTTCEEYQKGVLRTECFDSIILLRLACMVKCHVSHT